MAPSPSASTGSVSCRPPSSCALSPGSIRSAPATTPTILSKGTDEEIIDLFEGNPFIKATLDKDSVRSVEEALVELFKKQRPGEPPTLEASRNLLWNICFDPKRYDLTRVGRHKLNARLNLDTDLDVRTLTKGDIVALVRELVAVPLAIDHEHLLEEARDLAEVAPSLPWDEVANRLDEYEHFGNRRLRMVGELVQEAFRVGLYRMERVVRERMTTEDVDTITPQSIINIRPVVAALKEFFGSSQLSQFMDQTNSLAGPHAPAAALRPRRRRPHPGTRPHRGARRAPHPLRAHVPHRDA